MNYIDKNKLIAELRRQKRELKLSIQSEGDYGQSCQIVAYENILSLIATFQQEQPELVKGKFVFPNFLYARTVDNKTIDVSYAPQSMDAVEYIKNDPTEQPEGLHFTSLNRLIQKIPSENWNDTVNNYARKLRDCLIREGYRKDAEVLQGYISYMNGNNVPMATMDEQKQLEVSARHGWVARDMNNDLHYFSVKPVRSGAKWWDRDYLSMEIDGSLFGWLTWEDEPIEVELFIRELGLNPRKED